MAIGAQVGCENEQIRALPVTALRVAVVAAAFLLRVGLQYNIYTFSE